MLGRIGAIPAWRPAVQQTSHGCTGEVTAIASLRAKSLQTHPGSPELPRSYPLGTRALPPRTSAPSSGARQERRSPPDRQRPRRSHPVLRAGDSFQPRPTSLQAPRADLAAFSKHVGAMKAALARGKGCWPNWLPEGCR